MNLFPVLLAIVLLPLTSAGTELPLPDPPAGQVLDRNDWLEADAKDSLESELTRLRQTHHVDVLVVIWEQSIPDQSKFGHLVQQLGDTWSREDLWAVVLHHPEATTPPLVAWGGVVLKSFNTAPLTRAIDEAITRGSKEWSARQRVSSTALNLGEELVFLQHRRQAAFKALRQHKDATLATARQQDRTLLIRIVLLVLGILTAGFLALTSWIRFRSRPTEFHFPQTRWCRRLGAQWSGGSNLTTSFTPPEND